MELFSQQILCPKGGNTTTFPSLVVIVYIAMFNGGSVHVVQTVCLRLRTVQL